MALLGAAIIGSSLLGAVTSKKASDKQADGVKASINSTNELSNRAREDAIKLYSSGMMAGRKASQRVIDFYSSAIPQTLKPMQQGNVLGQKALIGGMNQANNALMGLPVDMSGFQPQQIQADYGFLKNLPKESAASDPAAVLGFQQPDTQQQRQNEPYNPQAYHPDGFNPVNAGLEAYYASIKRPEDAPQVSAPVVAAPPPQAANPVNSALESYYAGVRAPATIAPNPQQDKMTLYYRNAGRVS
jgi:hypothetical protein